MMREKNIFSNLDFPVAPAYYLMDIPIDLYTPIFAASRITGWSGHIIEQHDNNRLIRPSSEYVGPKNKFQMSDRTRIRFWCGLLTTSTTQLLTARTPIGPQGSA
jgi:citrate synthase